MKNLIGKIAVLLTVFVMTMGIIGPELCFANCLGSACGSTTPENLKTLKNITFPTTQYLNLGTTKDSTGKDVPIQGQSYFKAGDDNTSPTIAFLLIVIDTAVKIAGTLAVVLLIITGLVMIFSMGNQNTVEKAKQMLTYEIIGIIVIFLSYVLVTFVASIFTKAS